MNAGEGQVDTAGGAPPGEPRAGRAQAADGDPLGAPRPDRAQAPEPNTLHASQADLPTADHLTAARATARAALSGESHLGAVDDWRHMLATARDAVLMVGLVFAMFEGFGHPPAWGQMLVAFAVGLSLLLGLSAGRATLTRVQYHVAELERERREIQEHFDEEREEVRSLYAAKGFTEPLLGHIVDTLCADDDRLLKVMMEEELGLSMHHVNHPLLVGLWNVAAALVVTLALAVPTLWLPDIVGHWWIVAFGTVLLAALSWCTARATGRRVAELFASSAMMVIVAGGTIHFLSRWLAGLAAPGPAG